MDSFITCTYIIICLSVPIISTTFFASIVESKSGDSSKTERTLQSQSMGIFKIPKILHQTLIYDDDIKYPSKYKKDLQSFKKHNPEFDVKVWHRGELLSIMSEKERKLYLGLQTDIQRADMARYIILYYFGGVYSDLDMYNYNSLNDLFIQHTNYLDTSCILLVDLHHSLNDLIEFTESNIRSKHFPLQYQTPYARQLANFWMASTPKHPIIAETLRLLEERSKYPINSNYLWDVIWTTGMTYYVILFLVFCLLFVCFVSGVFSYLS